MLSGVLRDALQMPQPDAGAKDTLPEIPIDKTAAIVRRLLDVFTCEAMRPTAWKVDFAALRLALQLECPAAKDRLIAGIFEHRAAPNGWAVFKAFAQIGHPSAAKRGLRPGGTYCSITAEDPSLDDITFIPAPYLLGFLRASSARYKAATWNDVANRFAPAGG